MDFKNTSEWPFSVEKRDLGDEFNDEAVPASFGKQQQLPVGPCALGTISHLICWPQSHSGVPARFPQSDLQVA